MSVFVCVSVCVCWCVCFVLWVVCCGLCVVGCVLCVVCCVLCVVCCVVCRVWCVVCDVWCVVCGAWCVVCVCVCRTAVSFLADDGQAVANGSKQAVQEWPGTLEAYWGPPFLRGTLLLGWFEDKPRGKPSQFGCPLQKDTHFTVGSHWLRGVQH